MKDRIEEAIDKLIEAVEGEIFDVIWAQVDPHGDEDTTSTRLYVRARSRLEALAITKQAVLTDPEITRPRFPLKLEYVGLFNADHPVSDPNEIEYNTTRNREFKLDQLPLGKYVFYYPGWEK